MSDIKVCAVQMPITSRKEENLAKAEGLLNAAVTKGANLACLPEYFLWDCPEQGQTPEEVRRTAEPIPGPTTDFLGGIAKKGNLYICTGSYLEIGEDDGLRNTSALIGPDGRVIGKYSKTHPENAFPKYEKGVGVIPGDDYPVFDTEIGKIGIIIDMDATTAEAPRIEYIRGAEIILWPLNWSARWTSPIEVLPPAHCIMNKIYMVTANRVGMRASRHGHFLYNGGSKVTNPEGFTVARADDFYESLAVTDLQMSILREWRRTVIPRDYPYRRRPETYGAITEPWSCDGGPH
jgi:predicted amidohydrolase